MHIVSIMLNFSEKYEKYRKYCTILATTKIIKQCRYSDNFRFSAHALLNRTVVNTAQINELFVKRNVTIFIYNKYLECVYKPVTGSTSKIAKL